ncbi:NADPH-dependent FMN reductase [Falsiroseomonas oryziterrae]|uniref:NADPH-dependent FMN reductase n=1 Tax=Falsiroseomonas oryziterrae TaxID=2911368 RepID=UPI001F1FFD86|nr:NAD(P)H-dependent oxidoreductase [Roseomonas sp. NPKOSM-4]
MRILAISGSLRKASFNTAALRAAAELAPAGVEVTIYEGLRDIPPYDDDQRAGSGFPPAVAAFRAAIKAADAILIATPEYNYSVPGVLKNAIDWASRAPDQPFDGKPVAIMGASGGLLGTARAQYDLRKVFVFLNGHVLNKPEVMIGQSATRFDAEGRLTDEKTRELIAQQLAALRDWAERLRR